MKKTLLKILILCMTICSALCVFTACDDASSGSGDSLYNNTYYLYKNSKYDETNYIKLESGKFERLQTTSGVAMPKISGTYTVTDGTIKFYATEDGETMNVYNGTIKEGVLTLEKSPFNPTVQTFCAKGYTPSGKTDSGNNQNSNSNNDNPSGGTSTGNNSNPTDTTTTEYAVTYYLNYEGATNTTQNTMDGKVNYFPSREGYKFVGWYTDSDCATPWDNDSLVTKNGLKLYAEWVVDENKKGQLSAPIVSIDGNIFKWSPIADASNYQISYKLAEDEEYTTPSVQNVTNWTFPTSLTAGVYDVRIRTGGDGIVTVNSPYVNKKFYHKYLAKTSNVYIDDDTFYLNWDSVKNATSYNVKCESADDNFEQTVTTTSLNMSSYKTGVYTITITALRDGYLTADYVTELNHKYLSKPTGVQYDLQKSYLNWESVKHATAYKVYKLVDNEYELLDTVTDTNYNMEYFDVGSHTIQIEAIRDGFTESFTTTSVDKLVLKTPTLTVENNMENNCYILSWDAVKGASKYYIKIGDNTVNTTDTNYVFDYNYNKWGNAIRFSVSIYAFDDYRDYLQSNVKNFDAPIQLYRVKLLKNNSYGGDVSFNERGFNAGGRVTITATTNIGYTFVGWYNGNTKLTGELSYTLTMPSNDVTYTAKWCKVTLAVSDNNAGSVSALTGKYKVGDSVTVTAIANNRIGYKWLGWYNGEELLINELNYTFNIPSESVTYTAKWHVCEELEKFNFTSTTTTCTITGIKDKTVTEIIVPDYVTSIEQGAFSGCSKLESITLPFVGGSRKTASDTYQYPFGYIFGTSGYTGGTSTNQYYYGSSTSSTTNTTYYIPSTLKSVTVTGGNILYSAFASCSSLTSITIGNSVTSIGNNAFYNCSNLQYNEYDNGYYLGNTNNPYLALIDVKTTSIISCTIHNDTKIIAYSAFYYCSKLTSITIPDSVTSIGYYAFYHCSSLTSITIPDSVTSIEEGAFEDCSSLSEITIPDSVTSIGYRAFYDCSSLQYNEYDNGYYLGNTNNPYLALIDVKTTSIISCTIHNDTKFIVDYAFLHYSSLTSITIPDSVTSIGNYAFYGCSSLSEITIPDSVTSIGWYAFGDCSSLTSVTIGNSVTSIGNSAFRGCSRLRWVTFKNTSGWEAGSTSISSSALANISTSAFSSPAATYLTFTYVNCDWKRT